MTRTWKAIGVAAGAAVAATMLFLRGAGDSDTGRLVSGSSGPRSPTTGARPTADDRAPAASDRVQAGATGGSAPAAAGPDAMRAPALPPPSPLAKPSASEVAHRQTLAEPRNPERWVEYAKALDAEGKSDLALAALKRALHLGVDFEGRRDVMRLVREYEDYLGKVRKETPRGRRAQDTTQKPRKPDHYRAR